MQTWNLGHSISAILCEMEVSLHLLDGLGVVITEEGMYLPRSRAEHFLMTFSVHSNVLLVHTYQPHSYRNPSGTHAETSPFQ